MGKIYRILKPSNQSKYPNRNIDRTDFYNYLIRNELLHLYARCCICDWGRANIDLCHVVPHNKNGFYEIENIVPLCPNHHRLFDRNDLKDFEYEAIQFFLWNVVNKIVPWPKENIFSTGLCTETGDNYVI